MHSRARARRLRQHGRRDDVTARAGEPRDGHDGVGDPHRKGGVHDRAPPAGLGYGRRSRTGVFERSLRLRTSRRSAAPPAASARSKCEGKATERGCHAGTRRTSAGSPWSVPTASWAAARCATGDATWCSPPVPAPEAVRKDGPHSRECRADRAPGRLGRDGEVNYRFPPLRGFRHLPDMRTRRAPGGSSLSRRQPRADASPRARARCRGPSTRGTGSRPDRRLPRRGLID